MREPGNGRPQPISAAEFIPGRDRGRPSDVHPQPLNSTPDGVICAAMLANAAVRTQGETMPSTPYTYTSPDDPAREDGGLFGPESVTWRLMSSRIMWVAIVRALYLQALHPRVIRGTLQHAATITQPVDAWARLRRTRKFIETRTFGTAAEAERAGRRGRKIHESLTGTAPDGTRYRGDEPELLLWG